LWRARLIEADLTRADLDTAKLKGADLRRAVLAETRLTNADLREADLAEAVLTGANLTGANLTGADLHGANLREAVLREAHLHAADLRRANLRQADASHADLSGAQLYRANLNRVQLSGANLAGADLYRAYVRADLSGADLRGADLRRAVLIDTDMHGVHLTGARVHGISAWDLKGVPADQRQLVITPEGEGEVTVDNLKMAQFVYLILANEEIRDVIDTLTSKVVLILGRFTEERKAVLDALRDELRDHDYSPIVFDFDLPADHDITETVTLLARMARFVIADLTDPSSIPQELQAFVPDVAVPVQPIILQDQDPWSMFPDLKKYPWMLEPYAYGDLTTLLVDLTTRVIEPASAKREELHPSRDGK
jgi:uncharacterized protein YjbI with pentapeptide repeats